MTLPSFLSRLLGETGRPRHPGSDSEDSLTVMSVDLLGQRTALIFESGSGPSTIVVAGLPSTRRARSFRRLMRVDRVDIEVGGQAVAASVSGVGHRLPVRRVVPLSVALGLVEGGARGRVVVRGADAEWRSVD